jgi:hypothetical protein
LKLAPTEFADRVAVEPSGHRHAQRQASTGPGRLENLPTTEFLLNV